MGDTGLLCAASMGNIQFDILHGNLAVNMGSILENVFAQMFTVNGFPLWYFNKPKYGEIDFVLQKGRAGLPIEIKSRKDYRRHAALSYVLNVSEWALEQGIVFCHDNVSAAGKVHYLPWYMAMFLKPPKPISGIVYEDFPRVWKSSRDSFRISGHSRMTTLFRIQASVCIQQGGRGSLSSSPVLFRKNLATLRNRQPCVRG